MRAHMRRVLPFLAAALALLASGACPAGAPQCRVGADCASGACRADGTCAPVEADGGGSDAGGGGDGGASGDAGASDGGVDAGSDAGANPDGGPLTCQPNHDGIVTRGEVYFVAGAHATFRIGKNATVDMTGSLTPDGGRHWDLAGALAGDHDALVETVVPAGTWWSADFPNATYAAQLADGSDLLGVFEATGDALLMRGIVSPTKSALYTELSYAPPVKVLAFPLQSGTSFTTTAQVTGFKNGVTVGLGWQEKYESLADGAGEAATPFGTFPILRVRTLLTVALTTTVRSFTFVAECFGPVATVTSQPNEPTVEFTSASEARRLAP